MKNLLIACLLFLISCSDSGLNFKLSEVEQDFSHIENPKERWEAYQLEDYSIDQRWACECLPPYGSTNYVMNDEIVEVDYEEYLGPLASNVEGVRTRVSTIDEAFDLIDIFKDRAYSIIVEYHPKFGYPTDINIDIDKMVADEEIHYNFSNIKSIEN